MTAILRALLALIAMAVISTSAQAQSALLQGGPTTPGHVLQYVNSYSQQPIVQDAGGAAGGPLGSNPSEIGLTSRGAGTAPFANSGSGPMAEHFCDYDAPTTNAAGYHYLCLDANAQGGGLLDYGFAGGASALPFKIIINGSTYTLPFVGSSVTYGGQSVNSLLAAGNVAMSLSGTALTITSLAPGTFASLTTCAAGLFGELRPVSDSTVNTWGTAIAGGGADPVLAFCNGTAWTVAAK